MSHVGVVTRLESQTHFSVGCTITQRFFFLSLELRRTFYVNYV